MTLVAVRSKFQVTIPSRLRRSIALQEGDIMEATLLGDGILLRPQEVVDRSVVAQRIVARLAAAQPSSSDLGRSEDEIMREAIAEVAASRRDRRRGES